MKTFIKKLFTFVMIFVIVINYVPITAFAATTGGGGNSDTYAITSTGLKIPYYLDSSTASGSTAHTGNGKEVQIFNKVVFARVYMYAVAEALNTSVDNVTQADIDGLSNDLKNKIYTSAIKEATYTKVETTSGNNKSASGIALYYTTYTHTPGMTRVDAARAAEAAINAGGTFAGFVTLNGKGTKVAGDDPKYKQWYNELVRAAQTDTPQAVIEASDTWGLDIKFGHALDSMLAGNSVEVPIMYGILAQGKGSNLQDMYSIGFSPVTASPYDNQALTNAFFNVTGSNMMGYQMGILSSDYPLICVTPGTTESGAYMYTHYATILGDDTGVISPPADTIVGFGTPRKAGWDWDNFKGKPIGTYKAHVEIGKATIEGNEGQDYIINVNANFAAGSYGELTAGTPTAKVNCPGNCEYTVSGSGNQLTITLKAGSAAAWNNGSIIEWSVPMIGGGANGAGEQKRSAVITATVNGRQCQYTNQLYGKVWDTEWKPSGGGGETYTSWIGQGLPNNDEDKPYDFHSAEIPQGRSMIYANEVNAEDWPGVTNGIPSTENISVGLGASAGMVDIAGYLCARSNETPSSKAGEEVTDAVGAKYNPIVTRKVTLKSKVVNCWGSNNNVCQLTRRTIASASGGESASDGARWVYHVGKCDGHCCPGTYNNYKHSASSYNCGIHTGLGWTSYSNEPHDGGSSDCSDTTDPVTGATTHNSSSHHDGGGTEDSHDCTWSWAIYDSINENYIGEKGIPESGSASGCNTGDGSHGLVDVHVGPDCGVNIFWSISWKPSVDRQYYVVTYKIWHQDRGSGVRGCNSYGSGYGQSDFYDTNGVNANSVLCQDYTHGTGGSIDHYENCAHAANHIYTLEYQEHIDAYAYRTITDMQLHSLEGIEISSIHTINKTTGGETLSGTKHESGTECAPLDESAKGMGTNAPAALGLLWRCTGDNHGEYKDGNGRIYFEQWKEAAYSPSGNVSVALSRQDYFLGDVEVSLNTIQDSVWGNNIRNEDDPEFNVDIPGNGVTNRGEQTRHIHLHSLDTNKAHTSAGDTKYLNQGAKTGDCTGPYNGESIAEDANSHKELVMKELKAILNKWQGHNRNKEEGYHANVISDTTMYGGLEETTEILNDAYSVDGRDGQPGAFLFNVHAKPTGVALKPGGGDQVLNTTTIHRNHVSAYGVNKKGLQDKLVEFSRINTGFVDSMPLGNFGLTNDGGSSKGGSVAVNSTITGAMYNNAIVGYTNNMKVKLSSGDSYTSDRYTNTIEPTATQASGEVGITKVDLKAEESLSPTNVTYTYWADHLYDVMGSGKLSVNINDTLTNMTTPYGNCGTASLSTYCGMLSISNIPLVEWTPNGNWFTGTASARYIHTLNAGGEIPQPAMGWTYRDSISDTHNKIDAGDIEASCGSNEATDSMGSIYIYDPITVENSFVIGAQEGKWCSGVTDDKEYDQRVGDDLNPVNQKEVDPYVVQSQRLWTWVTPVGDMSTAGGNGSTGCNVKTGMINRSSEEGCNNGYVPYMNTNKWIDDGTIKYPFIAGTFLKREDTDAESVSNFARSRNIATMFSLSVLEPAMVSGERGLMPAVVTDDMPLVNSDTRAMQGQEVYYGNGFAARDTIDCYEAVGVDVNIDAYAINCFIKDDDSVSSGTCHFGYTLPSGPSNVDKVNNTARTSDDVDVVGSIGNVTVHDVEDFRFSNYFKDSIKPESYLIEGVIKKVDFKKPLKVVSTFKDIAFNDDVKPFGVGSGAGHATTGITIYSTESYVDKDGKTQYYAGMAGNYDLLPLVPRYNTVPEYKTDAVRLGYKAFISVDTIGNYYSDITDMNGNLYDLPDGPGDTDTREHYLTVESSYYLYDLLDGKFYDIDLWSGSTGAKERLYNGTDHRPEYISKAGALYQNILDNTDRRNIGTVEHNATAKHALVSADGDMEEDTRKYRSYLNADIHYIGTPGKIKLDTRDLSYIGSSNNTSKGLAWGELYDAVMEDEFSTQGQRYHFMDGLTSTTIPTMPLGSNPTQQEVQIRYEQMREEHPVAVIVEFQSYVAKGTLWTIKSKGSQFNQGDFTIYDVTKDDYLPQDTTPEQKELIKTHNTVTYQGVPVYKDTPSGTVVPSGTLDKELTPVIVYEAYHTAAEDRSTAGTH